MEKSCRIWLPNIGYRNARNRFDIGPFDGDIGPMKMLCVPFLADYVCYWGIENKIITAVGPLLLSRIESSLDVVDNLVSYV